jgi:hypothetical protein
MWNAILWGQLGAAIDMLENAITACPDEVWSDLSRRPEWRRKDVVGFWYLAYHTLFFLDLQLSGGSTEGFAPPAPFDLSELDPEGKLPERPYTKDEVRAYLTHCREKARTTIGGLTEEEARRVCRWNSFELTFAELLLYGMRHVQHHAGQLNLLLRQNVDAAPRWVRRTAYGLIASGG